MPLGVPGHSPQISAYSAARSVPVSTPFPFLPQAWGSWEGMVAPTCTLHGLPPWAQCWESPPLRAGHPCSGASPPRIR